MSRKQWVWLSLFGLLLLAWIFAPPEAGGPSFGVTILALVLLIVLGGGTAVWFIREPVRETKP